ncbi:MAG: hypothetical protein IJM83_09165 [Firmicutes bacterium]|nr:hypothetical protein [Bacillota bacterium]
MAWNILWHQAIIHSRLIGVTEKKGKTIAFGIPVRVDGTAVRILLKNGIKVPAHVKMALWYEGIVYPVTQAGQSDLLVESSIMTDRIPILLRKGTTLTVRIFCEEKYRDGNLIEEDALVYEGDAVNDPQPVQVKKKKIEKDMIYPVIPLIRQIEIESEKLQDTIVAFGDSITAMSRWTKPLAERLFEAFGDEVVLVNSGISGSCLGRESGRIWDGFFGEKATTRYERDVLELPNVKTVILAFGINDIADMTKKNPDWNVVALITETKKLIEIFHQHGVRVIGWTLGPRKGYPGWTEAQEISRQIYNEWVRKEPAFDAIVDPEPLLLEEGTTDTYKEGLHQGDFLHPSAEGGKVIANCFDLESLRG